MIPQAPSEAPSKRLSLLPDEGKGPVAFSALVIAIVCAVAYANSFAAPFVFDDIPSILDNPSITRLWPLTEALSPPSGAGLTTSGRPLVNLSLALNYAISGREPWSYHGFNLLIHILSGLTFFGLMRRSLSGNRLGGRFSGMALSCALAAALLWTLHPLQTQAVTYVVQRAESLMGLFYLLTLYAFVRSLDAGKPRPWLAASWLSCLLGMACKEVMVTAPVVVLLYDRCFVAGSFEEALKRRWRYYAALGATWIALVLLVLSTGGNRGGTFDLGARAFWDYGLTQFEAICRYLQLSFWPSPLVFEYGVFKVETLWPALGCALVVAVLLGLTLWALWRRPALGLLGACFFLILAPTSLMPGVMQVIVEHRMYLPLAAVVALVSTTAALHFGRRGLVFLLVLSGIAAFLTARRNEDYLSHIALWEDSLSKRPQSAAAHGNLASTYDLAGRGEEALQHYRESLRLNPNSALVHYNLGVKIFQQGGNEEALMHFREAVRLHPRLANAHNMIATVLVKQGHLDQALDSVKLALSIVPDFPEAHHTLGLVWLGKGQLQEALRCFETALEHRPEFPGAEMNLGLVLIRLGRYSDAEPHLKRGLALTRDLAAAHFSLGLGLAAAGAADQAAEHYRKVIELKPAHADAHLNLGVLLGQKGSMDEALQHLETAVRLQPESPEAHLNLGIALAVSERATEAVEQYQEALRLRPSYAIAHYNLGNALLQLRRLAEAKRHFAEALRLSPEFKAAREMLDSLP